MTAFEDQPDAQVLECAERVEVEPLPLDAVREPRRARTRPGPVPLRGKLLAERLDVEPEHELFARLHDCSASAREELTRRYLPLALRLARRYRRSSTSGDDLAQVASYGLLKAIDRFDPARGISFTSFAIPTISGELKRHFRDHGWAAHVPRGTQERVLAIERASARLTDERGRPPSVEELSAELKLAVEQVLEGMYAAHAYESLSLDAPRGASDAADGDVTTLGARIGAVDDRFELVEQDIVLAAAIRRLTPRERELLHLRFVREMTQNEIAAHVGISQMQVSRLLRRALDQLRALTQSPAPAAAQRAGDARALDG